MPAYFFHLVIDLYRPYVQSGKETTLFARSSSENNRGSEDCPKDQSDVELEKEKEKCQSLQDWRLDLIHIRTIKIGARENAVNADSTMTGQVEENPRILSEDHEATDLPGGKSNNGSSVDSEEISMGWGIVRLYRDAFGTKGLYELPVKSRGTKSSRTQVHDKSLSTLDVKDDDCTTLCILAVPSYLAPSDFLGFVGAETRDAVTHFRMVRTERSNRYMVLMKFKNGKTAREWRAEWNGKPFDGMEPEHCHVVFIKSVELRTGAAYTDQKDHLSFPDMANDPFMPNQPIATTSSRPKDPLFPSSTSRSIKPNPPPTPALVEMPTCPVCLERMDESTGLLTILCQHVFHCTCLQKWRGSGCPVCRYTQETKPSVRSASDGLLDRDELNECSVCHMEDNLWICLICGHVGCGRYEAGHAFAHYDSTKHCFAMDMSSQRVWDYASDGYVHRILQDKRDGKFVEVTSLEESTAENERPLDGDSVPATKLQDISMEYTALLTSQLDSQRQYYSSLLQAAADKASSAISTVERLSISTSRMESETQALQSKIAELESTTLPELQKDKDRESRKASKYGEMARHLQKEWRDEQALAQGLSERVTMLEDKMNHLITENAELKDQSRDLMFMLEGQDKIRQLEQGGTIAGVQGGDISVPEQSTQQSNKLPNARKKGKCKKVP